MKKRVLSAIILLAIFIPILIIGGKVYAITLALLSVCGMYEMINVRETKKEFPFMMKVISYLMVLFFCLGNYSSNDFIYNIDYRVMAFLVFVFLVPLVFINDSNKYNINDALFLIGSTLFIGLSFNLLILVRNYELTYIIYLFLITICTDTFAFFTGKLIGKTKLIPTISPNKTFEGLIGGTVAGVMVASSYYHIVINPSYSIVNIVLLTIVLSLIGQVGDLVFSDIKRYYGKKDFSKIIPGHGGVLDRLDSIIFVVLTFVLFINIL